MPAESIYRCPSCQRTYLGKPASCQWCGGGSLDAVGASSAHFDLLDHLKELRTRPEAFISMQKIAEDAASLVAVKRATSLNVLKATFQASAKKAKNAKDDELLKWFTERKDERKASLEANMRGK